MTDTQTEQTTASTDGATAEAAKPKAKRALVLVSISVPQGMKDILDKLASDSNTTTANLARTKLAELLDYTLPPMKRERGHKFATEAERKEATAKKQKDRNAKASALLAALEAGELEADLTDILARFAPKPRAKKGEAASTDAASTEASAEATTQASA